MKTKFPLLTLLVLLAAAGGYFLARRPAPAGPAAAAKAQVYQCPMHPWIKSDHAGDKCTICGMDLVLATGGEGGSTDPNLVALTPANVAVLDVRVAPVRRAALHRTLHVTGAIDDDDTRHRILNALVPGRIEKLFVNYVGAEVKEGDPLAIIYSPEMLTAQRLYVERLRAGSAAFTVSDRSAARERLLLLGLTEEEVVILEHTLEPTAMVNLRAPMSGTVVARHVYEGQQINNDPKDAGAGLFEIGDFSRMWFMFDAHESDLPWLHPGQMVEVTTLSQPGRVFTAPIAFINPNLEEATRTVRVRVVLPNPDRTLLHKQTAEGLVRLDSPETLLVPRSAVLQHTGAALVYVDRGGHAYEARHIKLGRVGDDEVEVLDGLEAGEHVVTQGGMIIDSQAQLARAAMPAAAMTAAAEPLAAVPSVPGTSEAQVRELLRPLAFALADGGAALATDDLAGYGKILPAIRTALAAYAATEPPGAREPLARFEKLLPDRDDLKAARRDFEPLSTAVADLVHEHHLNTTGQLWIYQCPMTPVLGTGRWLQRSRALRNPFFGSAMLECGDEIK